ncbi:hypothetical protein CIT26_15900 [Mesorhizobium temperatum]|uniref:Uncharacterized protein n=1 Tax=Mesorhizobium temperatum TaxID=241416 RepID=A0A271LJZ2_9HYPH|nr:hypothetical protein CIT26_15900 [Mesorhizobium temperatum]
MVDLSIQVFGIVVLTLYPTEILKAGNGCDVNVAGHIFRHCAEPKNLFCHISQELGQIDGILNGHDRRHEGQVKFGGDVLVDARMAVRSNAIFHQYLLPVQKHILCKQINGIWRRERT